MMKLEDFAAQQIAEWPLAQKNYDSLNRMLHKTFDYGQFRINVLCNPERIRSTAAKTDARSIAERKCFLCATNRPEQQIVMPCGSYEILLNPYPVFAPHFTIVSLCHEPQRLVGHVGTSFALAQSSQGYAIFFNGAACGASAPDHLHFQAVKAEFLPLLSDFRCAEKIFVHRGHYYTVLAARGIGRLVYRISCASADIAERAVVRLLGELQMSCSMVNAIAVADEAGEVNIYIIPRRTSRPSQFYLQESEQLMISPATLEVAGVMVLPIAEHFNRFGFAEAKDILEQVCFAEQDVVFY